MSGKINGELINDYDLPFPEDLSSVIAPSTAGRRQGFMNTEFLDESTLTMGYFLLAGSDLRVTTTPATPNLSMLSTSTELAAEEDSLPHCKKERLVRHDAEEDDEKKRTKGSNLRKA